METLILVVHVLAALSIIGLILIQQGKGASMGASFGSGAAQTVFGSSGGGGFLVKTTGIIALVFFVTSFSLAVIAKRRAAPTDDLIIPGLEQEIPAIEQPLNENNVTPIPAIEETTNSGLSSVPAVEQPEVNSQATPANAETDSQPQQ